MATLVLAAPRRLHQLGGSWKTSGSTTATDTAIAAETMSTATAILRAVRGDMLP